MWRGFRSRRMRDQNSRHAFPKEEKEGEERSFRLLLFRENHRVSGSVKGNR